MKPIPTILVAASLLGSWGCGGGSNPMAPAPRTVVVAVQDNTYDPQSVSISRGDTVRWVLTGASTTHTVTALGGQFDSGFAFQSGGDAFERTFNENNVTFEYFCQSHGGCPACLMKGSVKVGGQAPDPLPGY